MAHQPLKANFFPGNLEGLVGRLGLAPPSVTDPPTSVREGMAHHWVAALREAIRRMEGRDIDHGQVMSTMVPHRLHLDYDLDFWTRRVDDVAPTLTSPLLPSLIGNIHQLERPEIPGEPASFKVDGNLWGSGRALPKLDVPSPSHNEGRASKRPASKGEAQENEPTGQGESPQDQPPSEPDDEEITEIVISGEMMSSSRSLRAPLHQEVNRSKSGSDTSRIGIHTCHLPGSGQQEGRRGACLNGKRLYLQGWRRRTSFQKGMRPSLWTMIGSSGWGAVSWGWRLEPHPLRRTSTPWSTSYLKLQCQSQNHLRW